MSAKKSEVANNGSIFRQSMNSFDMAHKLGVIKGRKAKEHVGCRKDVSDAKKNICLIRSNNGKPPTCQWVGHLPNKMENYHKEEKGGKIFLIGRDLWNKVGSKLFVNNLIGELTSELDEKNRVKLQRRC